MENSAEKVAAKKRGWFQIHLSTAVVLMLLAGVFLWANFPSANSWTDTNSNGSVDNFSQTNIGWPYRVSYSMSKNGQTLQFQFYSLKLLFDVVCTSLAFILVGVLFEARYWGWSREKIFLWTFLGVVVCLQILLNLRELLFPK